MNVEVEKTIIYPGDRKKDGLSQIVDGAIKSTGKTTSMLVAPIAKIIFFNI